MRPIEDLPVDNKILGPSGVVEGAYVFRRKSAMIRVIASSGLGWEHVSVSLATRCPTWEEMEWVKQKFWTDDEAVMQLHPPRSVWVNNHRFCLHLWRPTECEIPLPDPKLVGIKSLGST